jgi:hypothetical protein
MNRIAFAVSLAVLLVSGINAQNYEEETYNQEEVEECDFDCEENKRFDEENRIENEKKEKNLRNCYVISKIQGSPGSMSEGLKLGRYSFTPDGKLEFTHKVSVQGSYAVTAVRESGKGNVGSCGLEVDVRLNMKGGEIINGTLIVSCGFDESGNAVGMIMSGRLGNTEYEGFGCK